MNEEKIGFISVVIAIVALAWAVFTVDLASKYSMVIDERDALQEVIDNGEHCVNVCADMFEQFGC